ncbi:MAG: DUF2914 domain-containing protein [Methylococcales bacterium]
MSEKKLVIKLKYGASAPRDKRPRPSLKPPQYDWIYKRIAVVLGIGVMVVVWLTCSLIIEAPDQGVDERAAESEVSRVSERPDGSSRTGERQSSSGSDRISSNDGKVPQEKLPAPRKSKTLVRAQYTWGIKDKEPTGVIGSPAILQPSDSVTVYFFSEISGMNGQTVSHRWSHNGRLALVKVFQVGGENRRVFSSMQLNTPLLGEWKVTIRDSKGQDLGEFVLNVLKPAKPPK